MSIVADADEEERGVLVSRAPDDHAVREDFTTAVAPTFVTENVSSGWMWTNARVLIAEGAPIAATSITFFVAQAITLAFVGHRLGTTPQAAFAVGLSVFNVTGMSIAIGFVMGLDTLCSQAHGAGQPIAAIVHRGTLLALMLCVPLALLFQVCEPVMRLAFGSELGPPAAAFLRAMPLYLMVNTVCVGIQRAFQAHQATHLTLIASAVGLVVSPVACVVFVRDDTGLASAAHAMTAFVAANTATCVAFAVWHPSSLLRELPGAAQGDRLPSLRGYIAEVFEPSAVAATTKMCVPALTAVCAEWWAYEVLVFFAAHHGRVLADAYGTGNMILFTLFSVPFGLSSAASARLGNALGAGNAAEAAAWRTLAFRAAVVVSSIDALVLLVFGERIAAAFTPDTDVVATFQRSVAGFVAVHVMDSLQTTCQSYYRGAGEQKFAARAGLGTMWAVGLPLAFIGGRLMPADDALLGITGGFAMSLVLLTVALHWTSGRWNWDRLAAVAALRAEEAAAPQTGLPADEADAEMDHEV